MLSGVDFETVRAALRKERETRETTRAKLEELSGISEATIFKIETGWKDPRNGKPYMPSADQLLRLIEALPGITIPEFFDRIGENHGLRTPTDGVTTDSSLAASPLTGTSDGRSSVPRPAPIIDNTNTLLASVAQGSIAVARSVRDLVSELRAAREHAATPRVRKTPRPARNRRTRSA